MTKRHWKIVEAVALVIALIAILTNCVADQSRIAGEMDRAATFCKERGGEWLYSGRGTHSCIGVK